MTDPHPLRSGDWHIEDGVLVDKSASPEIKGDPPPKPAEPSVTDEPAKAGFLLPAEKPSRAWLPPKIEEV